MRFHIETKQTAGAVCFVLVHHQEFSDLLRSSPVCDSPFGRLDPAPTRESTGLSRYENGVVGRHGAELLRHMTAHVPRLSLRESAGQVLPFGFSPLINMQE